jgi:hypothetical protein
LAAPSGAASMKNHRDTAADQRRIISPATPPIDGQHPARFRNMGWDNFLQYLKRDGQYLWHEKHHCYVELNNPLLKFLLNNKAGGEFSFLVFLNTF